MNRQSQKKEFIKKMEDVKVAIREIQAGVCALRETGLSEAMMFAMIQKASPTVGKGLAKVPVPIKTIKAILLGIDKLYEVTFPEKEKLT